MESYTRTEVAVGVFVLVGLAALAYLSVSLGSLRLGGPGHIEVGARFASVGALNEGAAVKMAGVRIGEVERIRLEDYAAEVTLSVREDLALPADTIASIRTEGLLGEAYVALSPGAAEEDLGPGGRIARTEPPVDLLELLSKYAFGSVEGDEAAPPPGGSPRESPGAAPGDPLE